MTGTVPELDGVLDVAPLVAADAPAVTALMADCERADIGEVLIELDDIVSDWQRPSLTLATDTVGVRDGDRLVAYAEVYKARRAEVYVHPDARGRGIGTALMRWTWRRARAGGGDLVGQTVPAGLTGAVDLFARNGYRPLWTSWTLALPAGAEIGAAPLPDGCVVRPYRPDGPAGGEARAVYETVEDAFAEWPDRDPTDFDDWAAGVVRRPGFEPDRLLVAVEDDRVVGACHWILSDDDTGWVDQVAVRRDRRGRGLGRALLRAAFRAARRHGATRSELATDSRTGALDLYRHVGMTVTHTFVHHARRV